MKYKIFILIALVSISCKRSSEKDVLEVSLESFKCYLFDYKNELTYTPKEFNSGGVEIKLINSSEFDYVLSDIENIQLFNSEEKEMPYKLSVFKVDEKQIIKKTINLFKKDTISIFFKFDDLYLGNFIEYEEFISKLIQDEKMEKLCFKTKLNYDYKKIDVFFENKTNFLFYKNDSLVNKFTKLQNIGLPAPHSMIKNK